MIPHQRYIYIYYDRTTTSFEIIRTLQSSTLLPSYFEFNTHFFFSHFSKLKIKARLKFKVSLFILRKPRKHHFPRKIRSLAKRVANFTNNEVYLLAKIFDSYNKLLNAKKADVVSCNTQGTSNLPIFLNIPIRKWVRRKSEGILNSQ